MSSSGKHPAAPGADFLRHGNHGRSDSHNDNADDDNADDAAPASTSVEGYMNPAASTQV
jgi:hypothetical protein